ncbi:MAG: hypothetical protein KKD31_18430 [Bacteroidetes bacterium]|nr:hypothetical protein [Bacteroidota bacterium]
MRNILLLLFILLFRLLPAQIEFGAYSPEQELIVKALDSSLVVVCQEYVIKSKDPKDTTLYGAKGQRYFGRSFALGIVSDSSIWVNQEIFTPWENDTSFDSFQQDFVPVLSNLSARHVYSTKFIPIQNRACQSNAQADSLLRNARLTRICSCEAGNTPIKRIENTNDSTGWVVMIHSLNDMNICDTCKFQVSVFQASPKFSDGGTIYNTPQMKHVLGGGYFVPVYSTGKVEFRFAGIIRKLITYYVKPIPAISQCFSEKDTLMEKSSDIDESSGKKKKEKKNK